MNARCAIAVLVIPYLPTPAWAHSASPGIGGTFAAFAHVITEPPAPLALLGLGLIVGMRRTQSLKWACGLFLVAMLAGLAAALTHTVGTDPELPLVLLAFITGILAASGMPLPNAAASGLLFLAGYFFGVFGTPEPAASATIGSSSNGEVIVAPEQLPWSTLLLSSVGAVLGANFALVLIAAGVNVIHKQCSRPWVIIGLRVIGSWNAAIAALLTALWTR